MTEIPYADLQIVIKTLKFSQSTSKFHYNICKYLPSGVYICLAKAYNAGYTSAITKTFPLDLIRTDHYQT